MATEQIIDIDLEDELALSYARYAQTIILNRAIPDVRDGLKPVQRRILYAMFESGNTFEKPYRKSAKTIGDVMGNYHPHGDQSIYDAMVRLAQPWKMRFPLVDGHGNFGSPDDDPPAAMRYTEARTASLADQLTRDIRQDTVDWKPNFDEKSVEPVVLPSRFPNLLVNGCSGVSTGFATEVPPHNLGEVVDATIALIDDPAIELEGLMAHVHGPDFPTGGLLTGTRGLREAYETGKGRVVLRARWEVEKQRDGKHLVVISELPYGTNKARMVGEIDTLRIEKLVHGLLDVRDESDREGLRVVIELSKTADVAGVIGALLKKTGLQTSYNFNMVAIHRRSPRCMGLKEILEAYVEHQCEVVTRRCQFQLGKALARLHIVDGLIRAVDVLDEVIATIRASDNRGQARDNLIETFQFSELQADAILDLRLHRLTGLQLQQLREEHAGLEEDIAELEVILASDRRLRTVIKQELREIRKSFSEDRRTGIQGEVERFEVSVEALVKPADVIVALSREAYIRRTSLASFRATGEQVIEAGAREGDFVVDWCFSNTTHKALVLTSAGTCFTLGVHALPEDRWSGSGTALVNVVGFDKEDRVVKVFGVDFGTAAVQAEDLFFFTRQGMAKRTSILEYDASRSSGIVACGLKAGDGVVHVHRSAGKGDVLVLTREGQSIRFSESALSPSGRGARGVRAIGLARGDEVVSVVPIPAHSGEGDDKRQVAVFTEKARGKRTPVVEIESQLRAGKGARIIKKLKQNPHRVFGGLLIESRHDVLLTSLGNDETVHVAASAIPLTARGGNGFSVVSGDVSLRGVLHEHRVVVAAAVPGGGDEGEGADSSGGDEAPAASEKSSGNGVAEKNPDDQLPLV